MHLLLRTLEWPSGSISQLNLDSHSMLFCPVVITSNLYSEVKPKCSVWTYMEGQTPNGWGKIVRGTTCNLPYKIFYEWLKWQLTVAATLFNQYLRSNPYNLGHVVANGQNIKCVRAKLTKLHPWQGTLTIRMRLRVFSSNDYYLLSFTIEARTFWHLKIVQLYISCSYFYFLHTLISKPLLLSGSHL